MARPVGSRNSNREFMIYDEFRRIPPEEQRTVLKFLTYLSQHPDAPAKEPAKDASKDPPGDTPPSGDPIQIPGNGLIEPALQDAARPPEEAKA